MGTNHISRKHTSSRKHKGWVCVPWDKFTEHRADLCWCICMEHRSVLHAGGINLGLYKRGALQKEFIYKKLCLFSTCLSFTLLQSTLHLMQYVYWDLFFSLLRTTFELMDFDACQCFCHSFVSPLPYWQNVSFWGIFHLGKQKNVPLGEIGWTGRMVHGGHAIGGPHLLNT